MLFPLQSPLWRPNQNRDQLSTTFYANVHLSDHRFANGDKFLMFIRKPTDAMIRDFLAEQSELNLTYSDIGATFGNPPQGFVVDHVRVEIGRGESAFHNARTALEQWRQFDLGWVEAAPIETPITEGQVVAIVARTFGVWWLNACRIVLVVDEQSPKRFGFAYGTLPVHAGSGEERFLLEMDQAERVWYDIRAFSKPNQLLTKLGYPYVRRVQKRFGMQSALRMQRNIGRADKL